MLKSRMGIMIMMTVMRKMKMMMMTVMRKMKEFSRLSVS